MKLNLWGAQIDSASALFTLEKGKSGPYIAWFILGAIFVVYILVAICKAVVAIFFKSKENDMKNEASESKNKKGGLLTKKINPVIAWAIVAAALAVVIFIGMVEISDALRAAGLNL